MPRIEKDVDMIWNDEAKEKFASTTKEPEPIGRTNRARSMSFQWRISWSCTSTL